MLRREDEDVKDDDARDGEQEEGDDGVLLDFGARNMKLSTLTSPNSVRSSLAIGHTVTVKITGLKKSLGRRTLSTRRPLAIFSNWR